MFLTYWAIKVVSIQKGPSAGAMYPEVHGPFVSSDAQKAWIRAACANGDTVYYLDTVGPEKPRMGRVTKVDGSVELA